MLTNFDAFLNPPRGLWWCPELVFQLLQVSFEYAFTVTQSRFFFIIGVATFRGAGGRWRKYDAKSVATPSAWAENQSRVWQFYHYRREE